MGHSDLAGAKPATYSTLKVSPLAGALGAEISGVSLAGLKDNAV